MTQASPVHVFTRAASRASRFGGILTTAIMPALASAQVLPRVDQTGPFQNAPWCVIHESQAALGTGGPLPVSGVSNETEPNDTAATANVITVDLGTRFQVLGDIVNGRDEDWCRVALAQGDIVQFFARGVGATGVFPAVGVYDASVSIQLYAVTSSSASAVPPAAPFLSSATESTAMRASESAMTWIVPATGDYLFQLLADQPTSSGAYELNFTRVRPGLESAIPGSKQIIFLDFDGADVALADPFDPTLTPDSTLTPLAGFLPLWGLAPTDENAVIDAIQAQITGNLLAVQALNPSFAFEVRNSRDNADPFGQPFVTRLVIGGTIAELGINLIGIAQSIDVGNFETAETAFILLDLMSDQSSVASLNVVPRDPGFSMISAIGRAVGTVASHELGHVLGCFHTESVAAGVNMTRSVMDRGSMMFPVDSYGVGPDGVLGTADDEVVPYAVDEYSINEVVRLGSEPTGLLVAAALSTPAGCVGDINGDGFVDGADIAIILNAFGSVSNGPTAGPADLNRDGVVDGADLAVVLNAFGPCP